MMKLRRSLRSRKDSEVWKEQRRVDDAPLLRLQQSHQRQQQQKGQPATVAPFSIPKVWCGGGDLNPYALRR